MAIFATNTVVSRRGNALLVTGENNNRMASMFMSSAIAERLVRQLQARLDLADSQVPGG